MCILLLSTVICVYLVNYSHSLGCYSIESSRRDYEFYYKYVRFAQSNNVTLQIRSPLKFIWKNIDSGKRNCEKFPEEWVKDYKYSYLDHCKIRIDPDAQEKFNPDLIYRSKSSQTKGVRKLAIGIPSSSKGIPFIQYLPLFSLIAQIMSEEHLVHLIIAIDEGDYFFDNPYYFNKYIVEKLENFSVEIYKFPRFKALNFLWNWMFVYSITLGYEYFFQCNDDVTFLKPNTLTNLLGHLEENGEDVVIGPEDKKFPKCRVLTQVMVRSLAHYSKFKHLYPPEYINWYGDVWITENYRDKQELICLQDFPIKNGRPFGKNRARYQPCHNSNFNLILDI